LVGSKDRSPLANRVVRDIPELLTPRLRLRSFEPRDVDAYATMMADPEMTRYLGDGKPLSHADAWRQIALFLGHWALLGFGIWAVEVRETGELAGRIGLYEPDGWPGFELGYVVGRKFWGRGYAREGGRAALDYARQTLGRTEIISLIRPANVRSIKVAESLGATRGAEVELFGGPTVVYEYPRVQSQESR
jgi:RimJ/RimL family protein N-acetyltransferase